MRVAIIHPWFPQYRKPFFDALLPLAEQQGVEVNVFHGSPPPEWDKRGDSVSAEYAVALPTKFIKLGRKSLALKSLHPLWASGPYDLVVLEQAVRNLETYELLLTNPRQKIAFWGHGRSYTQASSKLQEKVKQYLTRRGVWFFAYTKGGAQAVSTSGFNEEHITVVENSTDSSSLAMDTASISPFEIAEFRRAHGLTEQTALFIGGIDESKRIDFLLEASRLAYELDNRFRLLIAGNGSQEQDVLEAASKFEWVTFLGKLEGREKALAMQAANALAMPGRVGLVAVDSFAAGRPIVTTNWAYHAPEFEYLQSGFNCVVSGNSTVDYGRALIALLTDHLNLERLQDNCLLARDRYTITNMAENFLNGLLGARSLSIR